VVNSTVQAIPFEAVGFEFAKQIGA
jgi:hypothetical protein